MLLGLGGQWPAWSAFYVPILHRNQYTHESCKFLEDGSICEASPQYTTQELFRCRRLFSVTNRLFFVTTFGMYSLHSCHCSRCVRITPEIIFHSAGLYSISPNYFPYRTAFFLFRSSHTFLHTTIKKFSDYFPFRQEYFHKVKVKTWYGFTYDQITTC